MPISQPIRSELPAKRSQRKLLDGSVGPVARTSIYLQIFENPRIKLMSAEHLPGSDQPAVVQKIERDGGSYELWKGVCAECKRPVYKVMRTFGASLSVYAISCGDTDSFN